MENETDQVETQWAVQISKSVYANLNFSTVHPLTGLSKRELRKKNNSILSVKRFTEKFINS